MAWRSALGMTDDVCVLTADQTAEMEAELHAVIVPDMDVVRAAGEPADENGDPKPFIEVVILKANAKFSASIDKVEKAK